MNRKIHERSSPLRRKLCGLIEASKVFLMQHESGMNKTININPTLFWDSEFSEIDYEMNARQVIERVITRGSLTDWFEIKSFYGIERIKVEIVKIRSLDKVTLNFCSKYFQIPKNQFKCYNIPQSYQKLWNY